MMEVAIFLSKISNTLLKKDALMCELSKYIPIIPGEEVMISLSFCLSCQYIMAAGTWFLLCD